MGTLLQDVRFGLRTLRKNPGFTAVAVLTLALGIGGTTAIFSVLYCAVLDPLPYVDSHRLAVLVSRDTTQSQDDTNWATVSASEFLDYREQNQVFDEVIGGAYELLAYTNAPEGLIGVRVTDNTFRALGVPPLIGRPITPEDCKPGAPPVAVLSHEVWQSKFGADRGIVGRTLILNRRPTTVVGVMPPRFQLTGGDLWLPATLSRGNATDQALDCVNTGSVANCALTVIGHLKSGVTIEKAAADIAVLARRFAPVYPKNHPKGVTFGVESLVRLRVRTSQSTYYILMGAVSLLLLIACVNVANLLLARATGRKKEFAIRASFGASRGRLVRQLMIESLLLALGGSVLGCLLAWDGLGGLVAIIPPDILDSEAVIRINDPVLLFTLGLTLLSTLLFGLAPALHAARKDLQEPLKASSRGAGESQRHHKLRNLLVVSEVALSLVLLTGAGLLIRSFFALQHAELGYNPDNVLEGAGLHLLESEERYNTPEQRNQFHMESLRRVRALPGVVSAALSFPAMAFGIPAPIEIAGKPSAENRSAWVRFSSDGFFETMGIQLFQGRTISEEDFLHARKVAVVNRAFVIKYFGNENPLGRQIKLLQFEWVPHTVQQTWFEIVGVVADTRHSDGTEPTLKPTVFFPFTVGATRLQFLVVRTVGEPARLANAVWRTVADIDKELQVNGVRPIQEWLGLNWYTEPRFVLTMLVAFASLGLTLVSIGVYSVLSYAVSRRTHEIGVRMALGAQATDVRRMVLKSGLRWLAVGIGIGVPASIALAKVLQNRIWGIKSADPLTLGAVALVLTAVGLAACYFPARRATKVDPMVALRYE